MVQIVRLPFRGQYDWASTLAFLSRRAIDAVEQVDRLVYRRTVQCDDAAGVIEVAHDDAAGALVVKARGFPVGISRALIERLRRMFDLDADLPAITAHLSRDASIAPLVVARPGLRVFGGWAGFEVAARSVVGQQVTIARARQLNGILVQRAGGQVSDRGDRLSTLFPTPQEVLDTDLSVMGMPSARVATLKAVARAALEDPRLFTRSGSVEETVARLRAIRGIGDWTAHYIAMRACREPDAFPASDVGLMRAAVGRSGKRPTPAELVARAEVWRPWRAYAAQQLWAADAAGAEPAAV